MEYVPTAIPCGLWVVVCGGGYGVGFGMHSRPHFGTVRHTVRRFGR
jgi:hypothetical protein